MNTDMMDINLFSPFCYVQTALCQKPYCTVYKGYYKTSRGRGIYPLGNHYENTEFVVELNILTVPEHVSHEYICDVGFHAMCHLITDGKAASSTDFC